MDKDERFEWLKAVHALFVDATLGYRVVEWEFFSTWYSDLFNKGRKF
jgi:hypothetical protein